MQQAELHVELREKDAVKPKTIRQEGKVPGVFYAHNEDSVLFSVDEKELSRLLNQEHTIIDVVFPKGKTKKCIIREVQRDPVTNACLHLDVMGVKMSEKVKLTVPVLLVGTPVGVKEEGGILEQLVRELEVEGLPLDIPEHVEIDVTELHLGKAVYVEDLDENKVKFLTPAKQAIVHIVQTRVGKDSGAEGEAQEAGAEA